MFCIGCNARCNFAFVTISGITGRVLADCASATPCAEPPVILGTLAGSSTQAYALSADGMVVVGEPYTTGDATFHYRELEAPAALAA